MDEVRHADEDQQPVGPGSDAAHGAGGGHVVDSRRGGAGSLASRAVDRALLDALDDGACLFERLPLRADGRRDYRYLAMNPAMQRMFGIPDPSGRTIRDGFPDEGERWYDDYDRVLETGQPIRLVRESVPRGVVLEMFVARLEDGSGQRLLAVMRDVTARVRAENALRESAEKYRTLFERMDEGFALCELVRDADGRAIDYRYVELNPALLRHGGIDPEVLRGRRATECFPHLDPWLLDTYARVVETGESVLDEHYFPHVDRWLRINAFPRGGDRFAVLFGDVTERRRAEAALRDSEARRAFLLALTDALAPLADAAAIEGETCRLLGSHLGVDRAFYREFRMTEGVTVVRQDYAREGVPSLRGSYAIADFAWMMELYGRGQPVAITDVWTAEVVPDAYRAASAAAHVAWIVVPLVREGGLVGTLCVADMQPRAWTASDVAIVQETAERLWAAIERARTERALRESEERLRQFGEASTDVLWIRDAASLRWTYLSPAFEQIYGRTRESMRGPDDLRGWLHLVLREDRERVLAMIERVRAGERVTFEYRIEWPDGTVRWVRDTDFPIRGADGTIRQFGGTGRDVTAEKHAEEAERERGERQAFLLELSDAVRVCPDAASITDRTVGMLAEYLRLDRCYVSEVFEAEGYSTVGPERIRPGLPPMAGVYRLARFPETMRQLATQPMVVRDAAADARFSDAEKELLAGLRLRALLVVALRKGQGRVAWALAGAMATPRVWTDGERLLLEEVAERTWAAIERAGAEAALRASEEQFRRSVEEAPIPIIMHAEDGEVLQVSRTWTELTGYTMEEVPTFEAWLTRAYGEGADAVRAHVRALFAGRERTMSIEFPVRTQGGEIRHWSFSASAPGTLHDGRRFVVGMALDVTERWRAEEAAVRERASQMRDEMRQQLAAAEEGERRRLARELHDQLGQHLTGFALGLADVRRRLAGGEPVGAWLDRLEELSHLMTRDARYLALELRPPELDDVGLESALRTYVEQWSARYGVAAEVAITGADEERPIPGEASTALYRILQEALTNVAKHAGATQVSVMLDRPVGEARLIVKDDGHGFDPEAAGQCARRQRRLGLASMRERVALVGGTLEIESSPEGGGTSVYVRVPLPHA